MTNLFTTDLHLASIYLAWILHRIMTVDVKYVTPNSEHSSNEVSNNYYKI